MNTLSILGIDIAKDTFQVSLWQAGRAGSGNFNNDRAGFKKLGAWLKKRQVEPVWACMEATGRYGEDLAEYLHNQGQRVSVVNPLVIKAYAQSQLARNKTDKLDAALIARYCQSEQPSLWTPPAPEIRELRELVRHYDALQANRQQVSNRLGAGLKSDTVRRQLQEQVAFLNRQLQDLRQRIREHINRHPDLKHRHELLDSITGIAELTAAKVLAEDIERFDDARALSAYAGVTPMNRTSGTSLNRRPRFSKIGQARLRRDLYMPAVVAIRHNPVLRAFYEQLIARGKEKMAALGAVMHKLLRIAYGVLKSGKPFDPNFNAKRQLAS